MAWVARLRSPVARQITAPRDTAPVEREGGDDVEDEQQRVDEPEPADQGEHGGGREALPRECDVGEARAAGEHGRRGDAEGEQGERHRRARGRDLELLAGRLWLAAHLREAAEEPQVDAGDRDAEAPGHQGVPELVQDQRREVAERPRHRDRIVGRLRGVEDFVEVVVGEPVDEEEQDDEPARADADADAEDAGELEVRTRGHDSLNGRPGAGSGRLGRGARPLCLRAGAGDDGVEVAVGGQRAVLEPPLPAEPGRAEGVGDGRRGVADE